MLNYVLIKYAKTTHAFSVFTQYSVHRDPDAGLTAFTFVIFFLCSLHKNKFTFKNLNGTVPILWN